MTAAVGDIVHGGADAPLDVLVIGGGPAGLTAATYLRRFHRACVVVDAGDSRARWIPESHNCPGFPNGVSGVELLRRMRAQASAFDTTLVEGRIDRLARAGAGFTAEGEGLRVHARAVILAMGIRDRLPEGDWVEDAVACGALRLCSVCDAYEATDQRIGVYGPAAGIASHARFLRAYSARVALLPTDDGDPGLAPGDAIERLPAGGALSLEDGRCAYRVAGRAPEVFDTVYPFLGGSTTAALARAAGAVLTDTGEIVVDRDQMTAVDGLYAIGDVASGLNQISVAVGHAAIAATCVHNRLPPAPRAAAP